MEQVVIKGILSGKIITFSVDEKLAWLFKLYDKDSNGEIVQVADFPAVSNS